MRANLFHSTKRIAMRLLSSVVLTVSLWNGSLLAGGEATPNGAKSQQSWRTVPVNSSPGLSKADLLSLGEVELLSVVMDSTNALMRIQAAEALTEKPAPSEATVEAMSGLLRDETQNMILRLAALRV